MTYTITTGLSRPNSAGRILPALRDWFRSRRMAAKLHALPDNILRDIGVERGGIDDLALKSAYARFGHTSR